MLCASNVPGRIWVQFRIEDDYMEKEIDLRRLVIKAFHITEVEEGGENRVTASGKMTIEKKILDEILPKYPQLSKLDVQIIRPGEHDRYAFGEENVGLYQLIFPVYALCLSVSTFGIQTAVSHMVAEKMSSVVTYSAEL